MAGKESFGQNNPQLGIITSEIASRTAHAGVAVFGFIKANEAFTLDDYKIAAIRATVAVGCTVIAAKGIEPYLHALGKLSGKPSQEQSGENRSLSADISEPAYERLRDAIGKEASDLRWDRIHLNEDVIKSIHIKKKVTYVRENYKRPETEYEELGKKIKALDNAQKAIDAGDPIPALNHLERRIRARISKARSFFGEGRKNWPELLDSAEQDVRILEDFDPQTAAVFRAELASARDHNLHWK